MAVHNVTIEPKPAPEPGALDGWEVVCSECGVVSGSSMRTLAEEDARGHVEYMKRKEGMQKGAPFAGYEDFDACVAANQDKDDPEAYCGKIKHQVEGRRRLAKKVPLSETQFNPQVGDRIQMMDNTYWRKDGPADLPGPVVTVTRLFVNKLNGETDSGGGWGMGPIEGEILADSPTEITYQFQDYDGNPWQATYRKVSARTARLPQNWYEIGAADHEDGTPWARAPMTYEAYQAGGMAMTSDLMSYWRGYNEASTWAWHEKAASKDTDWYEIFAHRRGDEVYGREWAGGSIEEARAKVKEILAAAPPSPQTGSIFGMFIQSLGPHSEGGFYEKVAAGNPFTTGNPYTTENNPLVDSTPESTVPMTTRPRQLPGGGDDMGGDMSGGLESVESPEPAQDEEPELPTLTGALLPLYCMSTRLKFASRLSPGMGCVCGRDDYEIDLGQRTAMEGDPPMGMMTNFFPPVDEIDTSESLGKPFEEEGPEGLGDQPWPDEGGEEPKKKRVPDVDRDIADAQRDRKKAREASQPPSEVMEVESMRRRAGIYMVCPEHGDDAMYEDGEAWCTTRDEVLDVDDPWTQAAIRDAYEGLREGRKKMAETEDCPISGLHVSQVSTMSLELFAGMELSCPVCGTAITLKWDNTIPVHKKASKTAGAEGGKEARKVAAIARDILRSNPTIMTPYKAQALARLTVKKYPVATVGGAPYWSPAADEAGREICGNCGHASSYHSRYGMHLPCTKVVGDIYVGNTCGCEEFQRP